MKFFVFAIFLIVLYINCGLCFNSDNARVKRSNDTDEGLTMKKVTDGFRLFGSKVSKVASKGYEEIKNMFSKDRKVGDYQLDNIDVRVQEEEDYEEVGVKAKRPKRDAEEQKSDELSVDFQVELDEILKSMRVLDTTESSGLGKVTRENNAELLPGVPPTYAIFFAPLKCPVGQRYENGRCRTLV